MPLFYFHLFDGEIRPDLVGTDLPEIYTAQEEAIRFSGETLKDMGAAFWNGGDWRLEVTDASGRVLFILRFSAEERLE